MAGGVCLTDFMCNFAAVSSEFIYQTKYFMFKIFQGFHFVEKLHDHKQTRRNEKMPKHFFSLLFTLAVTLVLWNMPIEKFGIPELTIVQQRTIALFAFATLMWLLEVIPSWCTSVAIISTCIFTMSNDAFFTFTDGIAPEKLGTLLSSKEVMATFADPVVMLFLGGFMLAIAATKTGLDVRLARVLLIPFGKRSENVLLGFMLITGLFSMFVSNTATAAMMIAFLTPVLKSLPESGKGRIALALAIPIGANIGGMGTPIGTPPNAIALRYLEIGFGEWMLFMMPFVFVILFLCWVLLRVIFPFTQKEIELKIEGETQTGIQPFIVNTTFIVTILLWCIGEKYTGISANAVAMLPVCVFCVSGIIKRRDLEEINWSVLWMVAGGFALGLALQKTGLAKVLIDNIPFGVLDPIALLVVAGLLCWALSNFISNTATAALLIPILAVVAEASPALEAIGGSRTLLIGVAMAASFAMCLPISTPPNALAHSTGLVEQKHMLRVGVIVGIVGMALGYAMLIGISML